MFDNLVYLLVHPLLQLSAVQLACNVHLKLFEVFVPSTLTRLKNL